MEDFKKITKIAVKGMAKITKIIGNGLVVGSKKLMKFIQNKKVGGIVGSIIIFIAMIILTIDVLVYVLVVSDMDKFLGIMSFQTGTDISEYISTLHASMIVTGGFLIDLFIVGILFITGYYLVFRKRWLQQMGLRVMLMVIFLSGVILITTGFYSAMPDIAIPMQEICNKKQAEKNGDKQKKYNDAYYNVERIKYPNGFRENIYFDNGMEERVFQYFHENSLR